MSDVLGTSLLITLIGIAVLFLVLTLLAVLIGWITSIIKETPEEGEEESEQETAIEESGEVAGADEALLGRIRAAVIGVALARAELESGFASSAVEEKEFNPWREYHRTRLLNQSGRVRKS